MASTPVVARLITQTHLRVVATAALTLVLAAGVKLLGVLLLLHAGVPRQVLQAQDALITGILAGGFVWAFLAAEQMMRREKEQQARVVADLNHHLRNALDVILASDYLRQTDRAAAIWESVERIDHALATIIGRQATTRVTDTPR